MEYEIKDFIFDLMRLKKSSKWNGWEYHFSLEEDEKLYFLFIPYKDFRTHECRKKFMDMVWDKQLSKELIITRLDASDAIKSIVIAIRKKSVDLETHPSKST